MAQGLPELRTSSQTTSATQRSWKTQPAPRRTPLPPPAIGTGPKAKEAKEHNRWVQSLPPETVLLYTDGSKSADGTTSSAWRAVTTTGDRRPPATLFEGKCQIGNKADIEDGEVHAIQEALHHRNQQAHIVPGLINLCIDNQNTVRALAGGLTAGREYVEKCLKEAEILHSKGCRVQGKWTPSNQGIVGNE